MSYFINNENTFFIKFKDILKYIRKNPDCTVREVNKRSTKIFYKDNCFYFYPSSSAKQVRFLKANFKTKGCFLNLKKSKFQKRIQFKRFKKKWLSKTPEEKKLYQKGWVVRHKRSDSEFGCFRYSDDYYNNLFVSLYTKKGLL